eukprot:gene7167-14590_t
MSEYWVSQAKFHCKYCKVWMSDNKQSKLLHDTGLTHKRNVELFHKQKRDEKLHGARSEKELKQQLADIEKSAREAIQNDRLSSSGMFHTNAAHLPPPPPPRHQQTLDSSKEEPVPLSHTFAANATTTNHRPVLSSSAIESISENLREDSSGIYTVRGITYLEGQKFEHKFIGGCSCEIFVEAMDDWLPATIEQCKDISVPHTTITLRTFIVVYKLQSEGVEKEVREEEVKSDRLRLVLDASSTLTVTEDGDVVEKNSASASVSQVVESTGLGAWTTVSVKITTDEEEEEERRLFQVAAAEEKEAEKLKMLKTSAQLAQDLAEMETDSALAAFDPYNTGMYKGIKIGAEMIETDLELLSGGEKIGFKRRKNGGNGGNLQILVPISTNMTVAPITLTLFPGNQFPLTGAIYSK